MGGADWYTRCWNKSLIKYDRLSQQETFRASPNPRCLILFLLARVTNHRLNERYQRGTSSEKMAKRQSRFPSSRGEGIRYKTRAGPIAVTTHSSTEGDPRWERVIKDQPRILSVAINYSRDDSQRPRSLLPSVSERRPCQRGINEKKSVGSAYD